MHPRRRVRPPPTSFRRRLPVRWLTALTVVAVILIWWNRPPPDVVIKNQKLSHWLHHIKENAESEAAAMAQLLQNPSTTDAKPETLKESEPVQVMEIEDLIAASPASARYLGAELWRVSAKDRRARALPEWTFRWVPHRLVSDEQAENNYRRRIISILGSMGPAAEPAIPALHASLYDSDGNVGAIAADALSSVGRAAWPTIEQEFAQGPSKVRRHLVGNVDLARTIGNPHSKAEDVATEEEIRRWTAFLIRATYDEDHVVRGRALEALSYRRQLLGNTTELKPVLPRIVECLDDPDWYIQSTAAHALYPFGEEGVKAATPALLRLMKSEDSSSRKAAEDALSRIPTPPGM